MIFGQILLFILVLSFLVIIHELGHFFAAKLFGVKVEEFGLGYPPLARKLFTFQGTVFSLNWFPFGGFVRLKGEDGQRSSDDKDHDAFYQKSMPARLAIILAGATTNLVFGVLAFAIFFSFRGIPVMLPRIAEVSVNSPAAKAGIPSNVQIQRFEVDGKNIETPSIDAVKSTVIKNAGKNVKVVVTGQCSGEKCDEELQSFAVYLRRPEEVPANEGALGIRFAEAVEFRFYPWYQMPVRGAVFGIDQTRQLVSLIFEFLGQTLRTASKGKIPDELGSPIKIFIQGRELGFFSQGMLVLLHFSAVISINLAVFNVLPIPALDGGRAFLIIMEKVVGKKRVNQVEGYLNYGGFIALISLMVLFFARDIFELIVKR